MPCLAKMAEKMRMDDERIFGSTGNDSRGHCCKSQFDDGEDEHPDRYITNIRVYLSRELRSFRSDSHTICDSKHPIC